MFEGGVLFELLINISPSNVLADMFFVNLQNT